MPQEAQGLTSAWQVGFGPPQRFKTIANLGDHMLNTVRAYVLRMGVWGESGSSCLAISRL